MANLLTDDFSPISVGDYGASFAPQFLSKTTGLPIDLTHITISMKMQNQADTSMIKTCTGTWVIDDALNGRAHYNYQAGDVDTVGTWTMSITLTENGAPVHADEKTLVILLTF